MSLAAPPTSALPVALARGRTSVRIGLDPLRVDVLRDGRAVVTGLEPWAVDGTVDDRFVRVTEGVVPREDLEPEDAVVDARPVPASPAGRGPNDVAYALDEDDPRVPPARRAVPPADAATIALRFRSGRTGTLRVALPSDDVVHIDLTSDAPPRATAAPRPARRSRGTEPDPGPGPHLRTGVRWPADDARLTGLGARHHPSVDHAGRAIQLGADRRYLGPGCAPALAERGGIPQGDYAPVPFLQSDAGWAAWLDTAGNGTRFDLEDGLVAPSVRTVAGPLRLRLHLQATPVARLLAFARATGRPALLPAWGYGFWKSRDIHQHQDEVMEDVHGCRWHDIPVDAVVLDSPWETNYNTWRPNPHQFPDFAGMVTRLLEEGVRTVVWVTPWVNVDSAGGQSPSDPASIRMHRRPAETYAEGARTRAYLRPPAAEVREHAREIRSTMKRAGDDELQGVPDADIPYLAQWWMGRGSPIDFTGPGDAWWRAQAEEALRLGVRGIKADDGEGYYLPEDVRFADGSTGATRAWRWGDDYRRSMRRALQNAHPGDGVLFGRSGWTGQQATGMLWGGDQASDFWSLRVLLAATVSAAHSGISNWSHDVGGYLGDAGVKRATGELLVRWAQLGCFTPLMQAHARLEQEPWTYDHETLALFRGAVLMHEMLVPYVRAAARTAARTGLPIVRPLSLLDPSDDALWGVPDAFAYGPSLVVAPVVDEGVRERTVPLPRGRWIETWSGREVVSAGGAAIAVDAPLDRTPVWVRAGAIVISHPAHHVARGLGTAADADVPYVATLWGVPTHGRALAHLPDGTPVRWVRGRWDLPAGYDVTTAER
ncbi:glycoside hydrolase family 31 protein [Patulibacter minatonensis]|uniref:glycoside hydrolase family 31 protein n=1 Tax=Patulibacter minatonensis TaxID=298163 RepID=UPI00047DD813|nr:TIM-barrel domain-containing protein [Patulibacter minatonensis]